MSFLRHGEIYPCDEGTISRPCPRSSPWMSLQLVIPGRLLCSRARFRFTSRSYTANNQSRPTRLRQRTAKCRLTGCLSSGSSRWEQTNLSLLRGVAVGESQTLLELSHQNTRIQTQMLLTGDNAHDPVNEHYRDVSPTR